MATAEFWVQFTGQIGRGRDGQRIVTKARAVAITQTPPVDAKAGHIVAKMKIKIPDSAFIKMFPEIEIEVPEGYWTSSPIEIVVPDPPAPVKKTVAKRPGRTRLAAERTALR